MQSRPTSVIKQQTGLGIRIGVEEAAMSAGMWTVHYADDGNAFYFNSSANESVWHLPEGAEVFHPAPIAHLHTVYPVVVAQCAVLKPTLDHVNE